MPSVNVTETDRPRERYSFWLEIEKPEHLELARAILQLKRLRQFAPTVRNALLLFLDLQAGSTDELARQFPFAVNPLQAQLDRLESRILALPVGGNPPTTPRPTMSQADDKEIELEVKTASRSATDPNPNLTFMFSLAMITGAPMSSLANDVLENALLLDSHSHHAAIRAELANRGGLASPMNKPEPAKTGNPKAMNVPQFETPSFEEDDDLDVELF